jgi:cation:H+ antiporter
MLGITVWIIFFIGSYFIIFFAADIFLDNLKDICVIYNLSPFIIGMLVLGIDPEESIASIIAAINGLPYVSIGNVVGNSIIAMTLPFSLSLLFYTLKFKSLSRFYFILLYILLINLLFSFVFNNFMFVSGLIALGLYIIYFLRNLRYHSQEKDRNADIIEDGRKFDEGKSIELQKSSKVKKIFLTSIGLVFIFIGGELLILSADQIIDILHIPEAFFGFIIIGFVTNVEELTLILKSIKKKAVDIGFGGMIGKLIWNLTITFGISGVIMTNIPFKLILLWNWLILVLIIVYFNLSSRREKLTKKDGLILLVFFSVFIIINVFLAEI